jgi:hypothetical protein
LMIKEENVCTIVGSKKIIEGKWRAKIILPRGTQLNIGNVLYSFKVTETY